MSERKQLPGLVRFAVWLTFFNTWVMIEEFIIDRNGWWEYLPYYRVGKFCAWDVGAMILIGVVVRKILRRRPREVRVPKSGQRY